MARRPGARGGRRGRQCGGRRSRLVDATTHAGTFPEEVGEQHAVLGDGSAECFGIGATRPLATVIACALR